MQTKNGWSLFHDVKDFLQAKVIKKLITPVHIFLYKKKQLFSKQK